MPLNETDVARRIRDGELMSPLKFSGFWLVDLRITGTGLAYRTKLREHVWRSPELYLNEAFLARCNGLPLVVNHPPSGRVDEAWFREHGAGSVVLPYIRGDEVRAVCRLYGQDIVERILTEEMSTSPGVLLGKEATELPAEDGETILIEGEPWLLDHIALVTKEQGALGVWDKGGEPSGITRPFNHEDIQMDKDELKALLSDMFSPVKETVTALEGRMDSLEQTYQTAQAEAGADKIRADAQIDADKIRADAQAEADKIRADAQAEADDIRADAQKDAEQLRADAQAENTPDEPDGSEARADDNPDETVRDDADEAALAEAQARADSACAACGVKPLSPFSGEKPLDYRRRVLKSLVKFSDQYKDLDVRTINDAAAMDIIEKSVFADAQASVSKRIASTVGSLIPRVRTDNGREIREYFGDMNTWLNRFKPASMTVMDNLNHGGHQK